MTALKYVPTNFNKRPVFDRLNPEPPPYLHSLRHVGSRRTFRSDPAYRGCGWHRGPVFSTTMKLAAEHMPKRRRLFIDAGCGESPDADLAREFKFKTAVKIDLFPIWGSAKWRKATFIQGDICNLSDLVSLDSADMILCHAVLDLMPFEDRCLFYSESAKVLAEDGILAIGYQFLMNGYNDWNVRKEESALRDAGLTRVVGNKYFLVYKKEVSK